MAVNRRDVPNVSLEKGRGNLKQILILREQT